MKKENLIQSPLDDARPHVVLLGAGASLAAFPNGDRFGRKLPLMKDLVEVANIEALIEQTGEKINEENDFEAIYSRIASNPKYFAIKEKIEAKVREYFTSLEITNSTTLYDRLLLSLRRKDAVFTFNWDPFLFDAYRRNMHVIPALPEIFFLHGNVRIGRCLTHTEKWGKRLAQCPICLRPFKDVPLLYPVKQKNYSEDIYIHGSWKTARCFFREAFVLTIFGYRAPESDIDAVEILKQSWLERSDRKIEHIEVIDIEHQSELSKRWEPFLPTGHLKHITSLEDSWITMYPRRSVEALRQPIFSGEPSEEFPLERVSALKNLQEQILEIVAWEKEIIESGT